MPLKETGVSHLAAQEACEQRGQRAEVRRHEHAHVVQVNPALKGLAVVCADAQVESAVQRLAAAEEEGAEVGAVRNVVDRGCGDLCWTSGLQALVLTRAG